MDISVFGLGYVGVVTAALLAKRDHRVVGVDKNPLKVESLNEGTSPIIEPGLQDIVSEVVGDGRFRATDDVQEAIDNSTMSLVAVGTPSRVNGSLELDAVKAVSREIAEALAKKRPDQHTVVIRSTVLPGTVETVVLPLLEASGMKAREGLGVSFNPEFLREGTSVKDYYNPPFTVIGARNEEIGGRVAELYEGIEAPVIQVPIRVAEMVKYVCNAFHALKVTFANEIGRMCRVDGIDSHTVMDIICQDTKLNISKAYMLPGFAFGGSCLPKDLRALLYHARRNDVEMPVIDNILPSNTQQVELAMRLITELGNKRVALLGLSFKDGTDDVRESPMVALAERLIGKGYDLTIYDETVSFSRMIGANREFLQRQIPHVVSLLTQDLDATVARADTLVIGCSSPEVAQIVENPPEGKAVVDLVRAAKTPMDSDQYSGIAW